MSMDAVALVKIPFEQLARGLSPHTDANVSAGDRVYRGPGGALFRLQPLDDATLVFTPVPFATEPDEIALAVRTLLGGGLDAHDDKRGIFVLPDKAAPKGGGYAAALDDVGELGMWVPKVAADYVPKRIAEAPAGSMEAQLRDLMAAIPPDQLAQMESLMASGDPNAFGAIQAQLASVFGSPEALAQLQQTVGAMLEQHGGDPNALLSQMGFAGGDEADMFEQARAQIEALRETNPELYRQLKAQLEAAEQGEGDDDDEEGDDATAPSHGASAPPAKK